MTRKTKLLSFGANPDFSYMEAYHVELAATGFDGFVLEPFIDVSGTPTHFSTLMWGPYVIPWNTITPLWNGVSPIPSDARQYNFLRVNSQPGGIDWFDAPGMANVTANWLGAITLAKASYCKGIMFDNEPYDDQIWQYSSRPEAGSHTLSEYRTQVYNYAYALGLQLWAIFPDCTFFNTLNYWANLGSADPDDPTQQYNLLPAFFNGILDSMADFPCARFIQGNEFSYACKAPDVPCWTYLVSHSAVPPYTGSSDQWDRHGRIACATYATRPPYDNVVTGGNYFTPTALTDTIIMAAQYTDQYLWIYTGEYSWTSPVPPPLINNKLISADYNSSILNALPFVP